MTVNKLVKQQRGMTKPFIELLLIIMFITLLTACKTTTPPENLDSITPPSESPVSTFVGDNTADESEVTLKTGTYVYERGIYTKQLDFSSAFFGTDELYVIDCDNLLFAILEIEGGSVKTNSILNKKLTLSSEDWKKKFEEKALVDDAQIDSFRTCTEYKINDEYNLYLMDNELWLGIFDLNSAKKDDFVSVIKLKLKDESTKNVETLKISYKLLSSVTNFIKSSKSRYCQDVEIKNDNYTQNFDGWHISASFTLTLNWNYIGYDNSNSFNYGKKKQQSIYSIKVESDIKGGYLDHQSLKILATVSDDKWTDISVREKRDIFMAADVERALDETLAQKLRYQVANFAIGEIYIGPDEDVGDTDTDIEAFYNVNDVQWQVLQAYNDIALPDEHYIRLTLENGDTLTFYEGSDIAAYTSGGITEYYHTGIQLYKRLLNWALRNKDRIFITTALAEKIAAGKADKDLVIAYVWSMIEESAIISAKNSSQFSEGTYFLDAEITHLELVESYDKLIDGAVVELWALAYALEAEDISKIMLAGGMSLDEKGRLTNTESMGRRHPVVINRSGEREPIGEVYYLGDRGFALGGIRELLDALSITDGWFKRFYDNLTYTFTYAEKGVTGKTFTLDDGEVHQLWDIISGYDLILYEGMIPEANKDSVLWLGGPDYGIEFICGTEEIIVHDGYELTMYGTRSKNYELDKDLQEFVMDFYNAKCNALQQ